MMTDSNTGYVAIIDLNDCKLSLTMGDQQWHSTGFATLTNNANGALFGEQAQQQARLQPLVSFNQYWNQLSLDPINNGTAKYRHFADFAYQQLLSLHQQAQHCTQVIFSVPASFDREQLSLLLGICQQCPFEVIGLIDSAVAAVADQIPTGNHLYLDMQLHQCLLSQISVDTQANLNGSDIIAGTGLVNLYQHWAKYLASQFIQQCRFDPLHDADTEQQLYDLLPQLLNSSVEESQLTEKSQLTEEYQLALQGKQVKLNRQSLMRHSLSLFDPVLTAIEHAPAGTLFISERIAAIPELSSRLGNAITVSNNAIAQNCQDFKSTICAASGQVSFITALPASEQQIPAQRSSHLLLNHQAYPISDKAIYISTTDAIQLSTAAQAKTQAQFALVPEQNKLTLSLLNGSQLMINGQQGRNGDQLSSGDKLSFNGHTDSLTLINVINDHNWQQVITNGS